MKAATNIFVPNRGRPEPLWHQAERSLRAAIADGTWTDGAKLPNEAQLSELLGVSRITVRHALKNIEDAGLLRREHGRGTFVRSSTVIAGVRGLTSFTQEMAERGLVVGSRMVEISEVPAPHEVAVALEIPDRTLVCRIKRLRAGNDLVMGVQTAYLPVSRVPGLSSFEQPLVSLYDTLRQRFGITPKEAREIYRVGSVTDEDAELLEVPAGSPAFVVQRIASDSSGVFEFTVSVMREDRYEIRSKFYL